MKKTTKLIDLNTNKEYIKKTKLTLKNIDEKYMKWKTSEKIHEN